MEFKQMQVKVTTLNKSLFEQLEPVNPMQFDCVPIIHGWTNSEKTGYWFIIEQSGRIVRIRGFDMFELWTAHTIGLQGKRMEELRDLFYDYRNKYPQIFV